MSSHLRRFVTSPLSIFEYEFAAETRAPLPLAAAAKCLSLCIRLAPGEDFIMSNMYSLLNYISATSKESFDGSWSSQLSSATQSEEHSIQSLRTGLQAFNEDQQRLIGISTISVVTCLALEFKIDEVGPLDFILLNRKNWTHHVIFRSLVLPCLCCCKGLGRRSRWLKQPSFIIWSILRLLHQIIHLWISLRLSLLSIAWRIATILVSRVILYVVGVCKAHTAGSFS